MLTAVRVPARAVAVGRILLALGVLLTTLESVVLLGHLQADRVTTPVGGPLDAESVPVGAWSAGMVVAAILLMLGIASAASAAVIAVGNVVLLAADQQLYSNHVVLVVLLCGAYGFARADLALSLRARLRTGPERNHRALVPWWPQLLAVATLSACYLFAGLSKANPEFLSGDVIASMAPSWVPAQLAAWATVPTEIAIGIGFWFGATRRWALFLGIALHTSIIVLLDSPLPFTAFALLCFSAYPLVWSWPDTAQEDATAIQRSSVA